MNVASVKAKLKNFASESGRTFQDALTYYGLERTIYRIFVSNYADNFVLKGGIFLYATFNGNYERATTDADFLGKNISNDKDTIKAVFKEILSQDIDDSLTYDLDSIDVEDITEQMENHGLRLSIVGYLDKTRIPIGIDIGFGDIVFPDVVKMDYPVILDMEAPRVNAYSLASSIAEKLEAIIRNGYLNSRYKDFYDIYVLSTKYPFEYSELRSAVVETFRNRHTELSKESAAFSEDFINDPLHQTRWMSFLSKKKALLQVSLEEVLDSIKTFVFPLLEGEVKTKWNPEKGEWDEKPF